MYTLSVYNQNGKSVGNVELDDKIFDGKVNIALLHQVVLMYQANKRQGTASVKTRAQVSGGNSKPWRQKGTGRARAGSSRSPLWRKGGIVFGPHNRDYTYQVPKRMKRQALICSLNSRLNDKLVKIIEELNIDSGKTKDFAQIVKALKLEKRTLFVCDNPPSLLIRSARNIPEARLVRWASLNALDVLESQNLVITKKALDELINSLKKGKN